MAQILTPNPFPRCAGIEVDSHQPTCHPPCIAGAQCFRICQHPASSCRSTVDGDTKDLRGLEDFYLKILRCAFARPFPFTPPLPLPASSARTLTPDRPLEHLSLHHPKHPIPALLAPCAPLFAQSGQQAGTSSWGCLGPARWLSFPYSVHRVGS